MATTNDFKQLAGKSVRVSGRASDYYVPTDENDFEVEEWLEDLEFDYAIESQLDEDAAEWDVLALGAAIEMGEIVQCDEILAYHPSTGRVLVCDEGTIEMLDASFDELSVEEWE